MEHNDFPLDNAFINKFKQDKTVQDFLKLFTNTRKSNTEKAPIKSVQSPSAQIAEQCEAWQHYKPRIDVQSLLSNSKSGLTSFDKAVLELQFLYGLRISEVLNITPGCISSSGNINIKGLKGSSDRSVYAVMFKDFWESMRIYKWHIPSGYNRFYFYRLYKKKGLSEAFGTNSKQSVTHYLRYNYLVSLLKSGLEIENIRHILGHKSINSTIHYVENLKVARRS